MIVLLLVLMQDAGDERFFKGDIAGALEEYEKQVKADPAQEAGHWRRGIAYWFAGDFEKAAKQFELYHSFDDVDRENGIWRYLSQARAHGLEKAREGLLKYKKDDREPFPVVYAMFAGKLTAEEALAKVSGEGPSFYAHLYVGFDLSVRGDSKKAAEHLAKATAIEWPKKAGYGPAYMWNVGRLQGEALARQRGLLKTFRDEFVKLEGLSMAKYEVPQNLWEAVAGSNPSRWKGPRNSVERVTWDEAAAFCARATLLLRSEGLIEAAQEVRLPTEAEWESAARAGTKTTWSFGDDEKDLAAHGWYHGNAAGNDPAVGAKKPNPWGLYDVHGYLAEWCAGDGERRPMRGGSWKDEAAGTTSASRRDAARDLRDDGVGLRCALGAVKAR